MGEEILDIDTVRVTVSGVPKTVRRSFSSQDGGMFTIYSGRICGVGYSNGNAAYRISWTSVAEYLQVEGVTSVDGEEEEEEEIFPPEPEGKISLGGCMYSREEFSYRVRNLFCNTCGCKPPFMAGNVLNKRNGEVTCLYCVGN